MTEAKQFFTPVLIICSATADQLERALTQARQLHGEVPQEQVSILNQAAGTISIEMIRTLIQELSFGSYLGKIRQVVVLHAEKATTEAQNAMLKLFEEPPSLTQLWLVTAQPLQLLPTLRSRCQEQYLVTHVATETDASLQDFVAQLPHLSLRELSEKADTLSEREDAKNFTNSLLLYFHVKLCHQPTSVLRQSIATVLETQKFLEANTNVRLTIEQCFFTLKQLISRGNGY